MAAVSADTIARIADAMERQGRVSFPTLAQPRARLEMAAAKLVTTGADAERFGHELYLACACAHADPGALRIFERIFMPSIVRALGRFRLSDAERDEIGQRLRVLLFTGAEPQIAAYAGRGPLAAWLRTIALREAARLKGGADASRGDDEQAALELTGTTRDPEVLALRDRHREQFQRALDESILALSPRAKTVLRLHYVKGMNIDAIGTAFKVHRATVARWISLSRSLIVSTLRDKLVNLSLSASDVNSLTGALMGELHVSVDRVLRNDDETIAAED